MDTNFEQKVRERAYEIWVSAGKADGRAHEHWLLAEKVVATEAAPFAATKPARKTAVKEGGDKKGRRQGDETPLRSSG